MSIRFFYLFIKGIKLISEILYKMSGPPASPEEVEIVEEEVTLF